MASLVFARGVASNEGSRGQVADSARGTVRLEVGSILNEQKVDARGGRVAINIGIEHGIRSRRSCGSPTLSIGSTLAANRF